MRCVNRNKQPFWYAQHIGIASNYDDDGLQNGTYAEYGKPVKLMANISADKGEVIARQFGDDDHYDRVIVLEDRDTPINEYSVLWVDTKPKTDRDGNLVLDDGGNPVTPWDYIVTKVGRGLPKFGAAVIAISRVSVS